MKRIDQRWRLVAAALSAVAGFVDAVGFLSLGGYFVSFMSGNSTRLGVAIAGRAPSAFYVALLIANFVGGVVLGSMVSHFAGDKRRSHVLSLVTIVLVASSIMSGSGAPHAGAAAMACAMGAVNAVFAENGEVQIGLTYMTGTLVKLGQRLASAMLDGNRTDWVPYLLHWMSLVGGGVIDTLAYSRFQLNALWFAPTATATLALITRRLRQDIGG